MPLQARAVPMSFWERLRKFFFWREKSGPGRRIKYPIGYLKYPKSPNPTLQPCWVHPTKSQNSLQEVDVQLIHPHAHRLMSTHIGCFPNRRAVWREMGRKMSDFFSETLVGTRSRVDPRTLLSNVCWECVFVSQFGFPFVPHMARFGTPPKRQRAP